MRVSVATVWRWENEGSIPGGDTLAKVGALYGVSPSWLVTGRDDSPDDDEPPYEAWRDFERGDYPERKLAEPWMLVKLRAERFPPNIEPTVETYRRLVLSYMTIATLVLL